MKIPHWKLGISSLILSNAQVAILKIVSKENLVHFNVVRVVFVFSKNRECIAWHSHTIALMLVLRFFTFDPSKLKRLSLFWWIGFWIQFIKVLHYKWVFIFEMIIESSFIRMSLVGIFLGIEIISWPFTKSKYHNNRFLNLIYYF